MARKFALLAPALPGTWSYMHHMAPTRSGSYTPGDVFSTKVGAGPSTPGTTLRAWCALLPDDTAVGYIGTTTKLYQYDGTSTFTDRSKGGGYTNTATDWSFAQFGNYSLATNRVDTLQVRDGTGSSAFADCAGTPPKARIIVTQSDAVLLFDLNDGAEKGNAFAACAPGDHTDWSGASATTATAIRHRPGKITAAVAFRDYVLVFKRNSVYRLTYTGSTYKWKVELIAIGKGAISKHNVVVCGDIVVFTNGVGTAWSFDGASFRDIAPNGYLPIDSATANASYFSNYSQNAIFATSADGNGHFAPIYNIVSDQWGILGAYDATTYVAGTYRAFSGEPTAMDTFMGGTGLPNKMWRVDLSLNPCVIKADGFWGTSASTNVAYIVGCAEGIGGNTVSRFSRLNPQYDSGIFPTLSDCAPGNTELKLDVFLGDRVDAVSLSNSIGTAVITDRTSETSARSFPIDKSAVFARFKIKFPGDSGITEIVDYDIPMEPAGTALL